MKSKLLILFAGVILLSAGSVMGAGETILIDQVDNGGIVEDYYGSDSDRVYVLTGSEVTFHIRMVNPDDAMGGITCGFRVYSPDGANWNTTITEMTDALSDTEFDLVYKDSIFTGGAIGSGEDTCGLSGAAMFGAGMAAGFDSVFYKITVGPIDSSETHKTLCIDSSYYPPGNVWQWATKVGANKVFAAWYETPKCYEILHDYHVGVNGAPDGSALPTTWAMSQNYPNPFNPTTEIAFDVPSRSHVSVNVYNVLGQHVSSLVDEMLVAGSYTTTWDGRTDRGSEVSSGVYFYRIEAENFTQTKKMMLLK